MHTAKINTFFFLLAVLLAFGGCATSKTANQAADAQPATSTTLVATEPVPVPIKKPERIPSFEIILNTEMTNLLDVEKPEDIIVTHTFLRGEEIIATQITDSTGAITQEKGAIPDGPVRQYYDSGQRKHEMIYKNNRHTGAAKKWYKNGMLQTLGQYNDGTADGDFFIYDEQGGLASKIYYENGKLQGIATDYINNIEAQTFYDQGQRIKVIYLDSQTGQQYEIPFIDGNRMNLEDWNKVPQEFKDRLNANK